MRNAIGVASEQRLPEERAVGVAVEADLADLERVEHVHHVVGDRGGAVLLDATAEDGRALPP